MNANAAPPLESCTRRPTRHESHGVVDAPSKTGAPRPLRICHVSLTLKTGGLERLLADFARHHDRSACEMEFLALDEVGRFAEVIAASGCRVHRLKRSGRVGRVCEMARLFRERGFDVVHTHNTYPHLYGTLAARWAGVPAVIQTRHGQRAGHGWKSSLQYRWAAKLADQIVAVSHDAADLTVRVDKVPREKVRTIWNGIDLNAFDYRGPSREPVAISVSRLSAEKDIPTMLEGVRLARRDVPELRLKLVGDGPERARLERLSRDWGLAGAVEFCGDCRDVAARLAEGAVFVSSSLTEGISLTLLEAMAVGLPVIATAVGGNPEVVVDGETGRLVRAQDAAALSAALASVMRDREQGRRWGQAGRRRVEEHFDVRRMVAEYEALYAEIATGARRSRDLGGGCRN
jgi:glycosyltransferase involved in cell wall biosynthesis